MTNRVFLTLALAAILSACPSDSDSDSVADGGKDAGALDAGTAGEDDAADVVADDASVDDESDAGEAPDTGADASTAADAAEPDPELDEACTPTVTIQQDDTGPNGAIVEAALPDPTAFVQAVGRNVCRILYRKPAEVRAANHITLVLTPEPDVVADKGGDVGDITVRVGTAYLAGVQADGGDIQAELEGVLTHEMTHMYQNDDRAEGEGTYPNLGNVIEGVADFVRLRAKLIPPGSQPKKDGGTWDDEGYAKPAYFLLYVDDLYPDFVYKLNLAMVAGDGKAWTPASFEDITGKTVDELWASYVAAACCTDSDTSCCR